MTSLILTCSNEAESNELMWNIWQAIRYWKEYEKKEVFLCRYKGDGNFYTGLSIESTVPASVSLQFKAVEKSRTAYDLILDYAGEGKTLQIPADVVAKISEEKDITEAINEKKDGAKN